MHKITNRDSLSLTYRFVDGDGSYKTRLITLNNLTSAAEEEDIYQTALMIKNLLAYGVEKVSRRTETLFLED